MVRSSRLIVRHSLNPCWKVNSLVMPGGPSPELFKTGWGASKKRKTASIFLDEIGELSPLIQVKLLRVLQVREIERVGESKKRKIDIRVIAAIHRNLYQLV